MGSRVFGRLNCYSNFKLIREVKLRRREQAFRSACEHPKKALFSPRAAHSAENGYAAATSWTATTPPPAENAAPRHHKSAKKSSCLFLEELIEQVIFNCRFITLLAVVGSLSGSVLCFIQGCRFVKESFFEYIHASFRGIDSSHVIILLVEAIDVFLVATVLLIFGMGVYELFVNTIGFQNKDGAPSKFHRKTYTGSNLFGLFQIQERPLWLEIRTLHDLKTKVGHVIVMILLVGMFEKSKIVSIITGFDLLCFAASILMSAGCLFLLSKLHTTKMNDQH